MPTKNPFFMRHFKGDAPGKSGSGEPMSTSPDIILNGTSPVSSLAKLEEKSNYEAEQPSTLIYGSKETNYVYMRTINTASTSQAGRLWLWYAEPSMLLWPQEWMYKKFQVLGEGKNWTDIEALPNQIKVGNAFELVDPEAPKDHYCMVGIVQSPIPFPENPEQPFPGYFGTLTRFAQWIQETPYAAWRNTTDVSRTAATWNYSAAVPGPKEETETFNVGVQCKGMPVGSKYRYVIPGGVTPDGKEWETVESGEHVILKANEASSLPVTWPPGVKASMTITWWSEGKEAQPGAIIEPTIGVSVGAMEGLLDDPHRGSTETLLFQEPGNLDSAMIIRQHVVGGVPIRLVG
jgi:hypothetical protein